MRLLAVGLAIVAAACSSTPDTSDTADAATPVAESAGQLGLGGSQDIEGLDTVIRVTLDAVRIGAFEGSDNMYAYVDLTVENLGPGEYHEWPEAQATLVDTNNQQHGSGWFEIRDVDAPCTEFGGSVDLVPGDRRSGCIGFELPDGTTLRTFQFSMDVSASAFAVWRLDDS